MPNDETRLSQHIIEITYAGYTFHGNNTNETIARVYHFGSFSMAEIENIFNIRRQAIGKRLRTFRKNYPEKMIEIEVENSLKREFVRLYLIEGLTLFEIAHVLNMSLQVSKQLKKETLPHITNAQVVNMHNRHRQLCHILFGPVYEPDKNFIPYVMNRLKRYLVAETHRSVLNYYIEGNTNKESADRAVALRKVAIVLKNEKTINTAFKDKVICKRRK